ncbi:MAG TPA: bifunctional enoyl-CoA hydratase/phosphate acetyltransferase [Defluviitoga sp.]|nr:bifunctional enoyl-CoA hydratase/phosphate acetyltransferase [Defluviitoga sp.]HOP25129.1 bifunctional enoyl-CoA hydratase/phosphate acetyltransferase [Defluviitoga sp.]HPZ28811.1 bifunctional enoyl-CoA hydratase/phosphate acetyltransferase [Defluviitoga sp.]HQD62846.1 bifunctional enoyl-CoA hydratase/phosphate acetyltransferase [Defluviitoga sp.]
MIKKIDQILELISEQTKKVISVAAAEDLEVLKAVNKAYELGLCDFILFGNKEKILYIAQENNLDLSKVEIRNTTNDYESVVGAIESVAKGEADLPMKGKITTSEILSIYLKDEYGLKSGKTMNLVCVFEIPRYHKLLILSDAGMVISPTLEQKIDTINNAVTVAHVLGNKEPKVAILGALELVNPKMPVTIDAAILTQMNRRGQIKGCVVDGPFALDNAISKTAAEHKGLVSEVAGDADILIVPDIEAGNILYKSLVYFGEAKLACSIIGGKKPVVLTSRADSNETKLNSIAFSILMTER